MINKPTRLSPELKQYATPTQAGYIDAVIKHGSSTKAAKVLGVNRRTVDKSIARCQHVARAAVTADLAHPPGFEVRELSTAYDGDGEVTAQWLREGPATPFDEGGIGESDERDGGGAYVVKGVSTLFGPDGTQRAQWVKTKASDQFAEIQMKRFADWMKSEGARGLCPMIAAPKLADESLLAVYPMGDPHFGLHSWAAETGDDFDLKEAERLTLAAIDRLVTAAPAASEGLLLNLGDFFHADDSTNETPGHGNKLDVDSRYGKIAQVGLRAMNNCVKRLLEKHQTVHVWNMPGNHDPHLAQLLSLCMDAFFSNEPRVKVDLSPALYRYMRFGKNLIGSHHGHGAKAADLPLLMAADRPEDWGATTHRTWMCGHIHHWTAKEHPGCTVETFRTLAGKDAWHAGKGYRSMRDMNVITYHAEYGEIQRTRCDIGMIG